MLHIMYFPALYQKAVQKVDQLKHICGCGQTEEQLQEIDIDNKYPLMPIIQMEKRTKTRGIFRTPFEGYKRHGILLFTSIKIYM